LHVWRGGSEPLRRIATASANLNSTVRNAESNCLIPNTLEYSLCAGVNVVYVRATGPLTATSVRIIVAVDGHATTCARTKARNTSLRVSTRQSRATEWRANQFTRRFDAGVC
jgi:hypothetical protein